MRWRRATGAARAPKAVPHSAISRDLGTSRGLAISRDLGINRDPAIGQLLETNHASNAGTGPTTGRRHRAAKAQRVVPSEQPATGRTFGVAAEPTAAPAHSANGQQAATGLSVSAQQAATVLSVNAQPAVTGHSANAQPAVTGHSANALQAVTGHSADALQAATVLFANAQQAATVLFANAQQVATGHFAAKARRSPGIRAGTTGRNAASARSVSSAQFRRPRPALERPVPAPQAPPSRSASHV
jgi:hypothetical protein